MTNSPPDGAAHQGVLPLYTKVLIYRCARLGYGTYCCLLNGMFHSAFANYCRWMQLDTLHPSRSETEQTFPDLSRWGIPPAPAACDTLWSYMMKLLLAASSISIVSSLSELLTMRRLAPGWGRRVPEGLIHMVQVLVVEITSSNPNESSFSSFRC